MPTALAVRYAWLVLWLVATSPAAEGCGGGTYENHVYYGEKVRYRLGRLGGDWQRLEVDSRNDVGWAHSRLAAVVQANASCDPRLDIPLDALTRHLLIGFTERQVREQKRVPMAAREALRTHVHAELDGVPREMLFYVLKKDGCVYDFLLAAPPDTRFDRARKDYEGLIAGFEVVKRHR